MLAFAAQQVLRASKLKKVPIMLSHYPVPLEIAVKIGQLGIKSYLSGHVHCTNNKVPGGVDWHWYNNTAVQTDNKTIEGCFFSTGTTDVLMKKSNVAMKEIPTINPLVKGPSPKRIKPPEVRAQKVVILVGLPGSGKTTLCAKLYKDCVRISQDDLGSREKCNEAMGKALEEGKSVVVDRVNFNQAQRAHFIQLARQYKAKKVIAVWVHAEEEFCIERVIARTGHPTITDQVPADRRKMIVEKFAKMMEIPLQKEGFDVVYSTNRHGDWSRIVGIGEFDESEEPKE
jgi:predicted kinase